MASAGEISLEEYLRTGYRPDVEYLNGILKPKSESGFEHGEAEGVLAVWFHQHRREWEIRCALNTRTQVSSVCVRLVDLVVVSKQNREKQQLTIPPVIAIEVLDYADTYVDLKSRARDLEAMGVLNVWLIDPEARTGEVWREGGWRSETHLRAVDSPIFLDLNWVWAQMDQ